MTRLTSANLGLLARTVAVPTYDRSAVTPGIVHLSVGGFHRSHEAMYVDALMNQGQAMDWGIRGVGLLETNAHMRDVLRAQDGLYTLVVKHGDGTWEPRVIGSMIDYLYAPDDPEAVIAAMADPRIRIVSMTVTEGGYNIDAADRRVRRTSATTSRPTSGREPSRGRCSASSSRRWPGVATPASPRSRSCRATTSRATATSPSGCSPRSPGCATPTLAEWIDGHRPVPQLDGRPDHAADERGRPARGGPPLRRRGRLAGAVRAVLPMGAGGRLQRGPAALRAGGRPDRGRRGAVRADEAAAAQRQPPGALLPRLPRRLPLRARGHDATRCSPASSSTT